MSIRDTHKGSKTKHQLENQAIISKEFGKGDNNGKTAQTWANREKDWYNAERRFIFASDKKNEFKRLLDAIFAGKRKRFSNEPKTVPAANRSHTKNKPSFGPDDN